MKGPMTDLPRLRQSPTDPSFVQNPSSLYTLAHSLGPAFHWEDYELDCIVSYDLARAIFSDKRFGRQDPTPPLRPEHQAAFWAVEDHSMLELEAPRHPKLRAQVLRDFTSKRVRALAPDIQALADDLIDQFPAGPFDLLDAYARTLPVVIIARLLGAPEDDAQQLLMWSNAMVKMYQAKRSHSDEQQAAQAAANFSAYIQDLIREKIRHPKNDLISALLQAQADGSGLSHAEIVTTCILLLNAGHEATVHTLGNTVKTLLDTQTPFSEDCVEEAMRFDPPLHLFTRYVYEDAEIAGVSFAKGTQIALLLGAANRDPKRWDNPNVFDPTRPVQQHLAFGAGGHFCLGAPLARLELKIGLETLFRRCPALKMTQTPEYADIFHFHGLDALIVSV